jgi:hypothetical protein
VAFRLAPLNSNYKGIPAKSTKPLCADSSETRLSSVQTIQPTHTKPAIDRKNKVRTAKLQPVFTAACGAADPDQSKDARGGFIRLRRQQLIAPHAPACQWHQHRAGKIRSWRYGCRERQWSWTSPCVSWIGIEIEQPHRRSVRIQVPPVPCKSTT